jgi:hypothetical protein
VHGRERGATLVELALILPLLAGLLFGIIDFGFGLDNLSALRQGTREGARRAVVADFGTDASCPVTGASPNTATHQFVCLTKDRIGLDDGDVRVKLAFDPAYERENDLIVCTQYPVESITGMYDAALDGRVMTSRVVMRIEEVSADLTAMQETSLSGGSWGFCS